MDEKNAQESALELKFFQIPIKAYAKDMERDLSKEKKEEILELFTTYNKLRSEAEFSEIRDDLHYACRKGDVELIKILLSEMIENSREGLTFKIDETNQTASLFKVNGNIEELIIPRTVEHKSTEYLITSIKGIGKNNVKTIKFSEDSAVKTFYRNAFSSSKIEEIYFPESLKELKEGWCRRTNNLKKIIISPLNGQFKFEDDTYLISKSELNNDEFDNLLYVRRDIEKFSIPSNIKIISSYAFSLSNIESIFIPPKVSKICEYAFENCRYLKKVEIPINSNLQAIESHAFTSSGIESIFIPSKVSKISDSTFYTCKNLKKIEIPTNSNLQTIESHAFTCSKIEELYFPACLKKLKEGWCDITSKLKKIKISPSNGQFKFEDDTYLITKSESNSDEFDTLLFVRRNIKKFSIPSNVKIISSYAFSSSSIESIFIPLNITQICKSSFSNCKGLTKVEIPTNSNLQTIESLVFSSSCIESIFIPPKVSKICSNAFSHCINLKKVEIPTNSNLQTIESHAFSYSNIRSIFIPSQVSKICKDTFDNCRNLEKVEFPTDSNLQIIESDAFSSTSIEEIYFPAGLKELKERWYPTANKLKKIIISPSNDHFKFIDDAYLITKSDSNNDEFDNLLFVRYELKKFSIPSNIRIISSNAFSWSKIESIFIPSKVSKICIDAFLYCENLKKIEIPTNSNLQTIESDAFTWSNIESIFIPSKVSKICKDSFHYCQNLQIIEISEESELELISFVTFEKNKRNIIMIPSSLRKLTNEPI